MLQVHSSDDRVLAAKKDVHQPPLNDRKVIDVAGGVPPQPSGQVVRQSQDNHGRQEQGRGVRLSQQKPKKAPRRGLIDDFMPPAQVVCYKVHTCTCMSSNKTLKVPHPRKLLPLKFSHYTLYM